MNRAELARKIDHTLLKPETTRDQIDRLCDEAIEHGFWSVVVSPVYVARAVSRLDGSPTRVGSVAGFPLGAMSPAVIAEEARRAINEGAREIDMVAWIGGLRDGEKRNVVRAVYDVACVVHGAGPNHVLKVILETTALTHEEIILGCRCCAEGEADFVKTSTGLHPTGGATPEHVALLRRHAAPLKVKAAGGIRTLAQALALIDAGADRLGTSTSVALMSEL